MCVSSSFFFFFFLASAASGDVASATAMNSRIPHAAMDGHRRAMVGADVA